ncbi:hypothetical protein BDA96_01G074700 [Sorghum bicolor]|uniref:F-box domain-containing protein n=2 Tax=Sorghum bicolor TaxID=4558 RepID=A0A921UWU9_SORBI|nr:hypothetical protein BDA96_01G074700 [Sorghum bicolor]OQU90906.1 hypothetical protein SORBI_3001G072100 [Sorghum bicolor]
MSWAKRRRRIGTCHGTTTGVESEPPHIPDDILIEIFARSDAKTIIRAAATSKPIRRAILSPDFRRHAASATATGVGGGFDPDLLLGASCVLDKDSCSRDVFFQKQRLPFTFETKCLGRMEPMTSRGCLVVLHRRTALSAELHVVNTLTGRVSRVCSPGISAMYPRTLLAVGDAGRSFEILVAETNLVTRVFSSERGDWGDVVHTRLPPNFIRTLPNRCSPPLVLGGTTVHWLCKEQCIVALDVSTATATVIELPPQCFSQVARCPKHTDNGLLASSADGRLSLLVARSGAISMWSLSASAPAARWTLQVVIQRHAIARKRPGCAVRFLQFGERSGAVMLQVGGVGLVQIDLGSREAHVLSDEFKKIGESLIKNSTGLQLCLHETDQPTLFESAIKNMKRF